VIDALLRGSDRLARLIGALLVMLVTVMLCSLALQVFMRYVVGQALAWSEELALACFSWSTLLAMALALREGAHVRMDLVLARLPPAWRRTAESLVLLLVAAFGAVLAWAGGSYLMQTRGSTSAAIGYPIGWLYAAAPVGGGLIGWFSLERLLRLWVTTGDAAGIGPPPGVGGRAA
jgi:TRAP-type C4-dicarboxylate transport system permease small subunit